MKIFNYQIDKGTIILITGIVLVFTGIIVYSNYRNNLINEKGIIVPAKIVEIKLNARKGNVTSRDIVFYSYVVNNKVYKDFIEFYNDVKIGDCYELRVIDNNPEMALIDLNKKISCE